MNMVAPLYLLQKLLPLIRKGAAKKILLLSSNMGSIQNAPLLVGCAESYSITKAALNMFVHTSIYTSGQLLINTARIGRKWGARLKTEGITVVVAHPGMSCPPHSQPLPHQ